MFSHQEGGMSWLPSLPTASLLTQHHWKTKLGVQPSADSLILSFSDWQTGKIMPHPETAAKTRATTEILSTSCKGGERPGEKKGKQSLKLGAMSQ